MFHKKGILKKFAIQSKTLVAKSLFNKVAGFLASNFTKQEPPTMVFSCGFCECLKIAFFIDLQVTVHVTLKIIP